MGRIFSDDEPYPVACITLATQESTKQHILFQTRYKVEGAYDVVEDASLDKVVEVKTGRKFGGTDRDCISLEWAIKALSVSIFRDWSFSRARVTLACELENAQELLPTLPNVSTIRGGQYPYLTVDDEIRIYVGYVKDPFIPITGDILDEIPFRIQTTEGKLRAGDIPDSDRASGDTEREEGTGDVLEELQDLVQPDYSKKLIPIFWGFIDKIDYDGSSRGTGHQVILSCRDRVRVLADTTLLAVPALSGVFGNQRSKVLPDGALHKIVSDVAKSVNGLHVNIAEEDQEVCWKRIITPDLSFEELQGLATTVIDELRAASQFCEFFSADAFRNQTITDPVIIASIQDPSLFVRRATFKIMDHLARPRFHMWLSRPPLAKQGGTANWTVLDKTPLSIIKWISSKEERPLDFFASHVNGDFCLVPRVLDVSGFNDRDRMFRTYFFRTWPKKDTNGISIDPPCQNQLIIDLRSFTNIVGTYNRITVVDNSNPTGIGLAVLDSVQLTIDRIPFILEQRTIRPPCRLRLIYDGSLSSYDNSNGGALLVAIAASAQFARDVSGVEFTVVGDPTFFPGEAVRIYNTFLHDAQAQSQTGTQLSLLEKEEIANRVRNTFSKTSAPSAANKFGNDPKDVLVYEEDNKVVREAVIAGTVATDIQNLILPVYKVRSVHHSLTIAGRNPGFTTKITANMDLNN